MRRILILLLTANIVLTNCTISEKTSDTKSLKFADNKDKSPFTKDYQATNDTNKLSCKKTTPELQERRVSLLNDLREQIITKKDLENGYAFKFSGTDIILDRLSEFIKLERACCSFFFFRLSISGDSSEIWLELTGPEGVKDFIPNELKI